MTEAMPFLQKTILLSYDPRPFGAEVFCVWRKPIKIFRQKACSLLRTDFVRRWRTKSTLAA